MVVVADGRLARQTHRHTVLLKLTLQTDAFDAVVRHAVVFGVRLEELRFDGGEKGLTRPFISTQFNSSLLLPGHVCLMTNKIVIHVIDYKDFEEKPRGVDLSIMMDRLEILGITIARHSSLPT